MEIISSLPLLGTLLALALVDGTSLGTLGLPVWMLAQPTVRARAVLTYLGALAAFYLVLGVVLLLGVRTGLESIGDFGDTEAAAWIQVGVGVVLFLSSFLFDGPIGRWRRQRRQQKTRLSTWEKLKRSTTGPNAGSSAMVRLALAAGAVEAMSMVPYLAAIGLLSARGVHAAEGAVVLALYCAVMVLPALALLVLRLAVSSKIEPTLARLSGWFDRNGNDLLAWTLGIIGFLLVSDGMGRLRSFIDALGA